jgi:hypothetical protein
LAAVAARTIDANTLLALAVELTVDIRQRGSASGQMQEFAAGKFHF